MPTKLPGAGKIFLPTHHLLRRTACQDS